MAQPPHVNSTFTSSARSRSRRKSHFIAAVFLKLGDRLKKAQFAGTGMPELERLFLVKYSDGTVSR